MADNTQVSNGTGDVVRDKDRAGVKTQIVGIDVNVGGTSETLMTPTNGLPTRLTDGSGGYLNRAYGPVRVSAEERTLFLDTHDQTLDTTNRWVTPTGANAPSVSGTVLTFGTAVTASAFGKLPSQPSFSPQIPGFLQPSFAIKLDAAGAAAVGGHRFWGIGTSPATPATTSAATKLTDAIGWEIDTDGKLYAVVYTAGVRTAIDLSASGTASQQLDGAYHRYLCQIRTDRIYWFIDGLSTPVATQSFVTPSTQTLPVLLQTINPATSVATGGYPLLVQGSVVADTAGNSTQLSDGQFPWRKATVKAASTAVVATDFPQAVALHPTSPLPAGTNSIGSVNLATSAPTAAATVGTISTAQAQATGVASTTGQVVIDVSQYGNVTFHLVTAAFVGTLQFEATLDTAGTSATWGPWTCLDENVAGVGNVTSLSINTAVALVKQFTAPTPGPKYLKIRCSAFTSGTVAVVAQPGPQILETSPSLGPSTAQIGTVGLAQTATTGVASGNIFKFRANPTTITASTAVVAAQAGLSAYITDFIVSNAGATINTVTLLDGASAVLDIVAAATGGGGTVNLKTPIKCTTNTALNYTTSAASSTFVTVTGYLAP